MLTSGCATAFVRSENAVHSQHVFPATALDAQFLWHNGLKGEPLFATIDPNERNRPPARIAYTLGAVVDFPVSVVFDTILVPVDLMRSKAPAENRDNKGEPDGAADGSQPPCSEGQTQSNGNLVWHGFPILAPISDVDPSVRHKVEVKVPTQLTVERGSNTLSITVDRNSREPTNILVGSKMVTGVQWHTYIYPEGETRPSRTDRGGLSGGGSSGGFDFNLGTTFLHTKPDGIPVAGKNYVVEMDLSIFETDIPAQHMWSPYSTNYRILWERTLRQLVE